MMDQKERDEIFLRIYSLLKAVKKCDCTPCEAAEEIMEKVDVAYHNGILTGHNEACE